MRLPEVSRAIFSPPGCSVTVTAAVEQQVRIASEKPRRVDAKGQIGRGPLVAIAGDGGFGLGIGPQGLHRFSSHPRFVEARSGAFSPPDGACEGLLSPSNCHGTR